MMELVVSVLYEYFSVLFVFLYMVCVLQHPLLGLQHFSALLSRSASSPSAWTVSPFDSLLKAGGERFGGGG